MSATMAPPRAFEIRGREWIIRPWETTLQLPELDEDAGVIGLRVPQEIMGIPCAIGWLVGAWTGELRGIGIGFPNTWVIAVRLLPGDPLNRVEAGAYPSFPLMGDALARRELFAPDIDPDYDAMELLALIREVAGREHEA